MPDKLIINIRISLLMILLCTVNNRLYAQPEGIKVSQERVFSNSFQKAVYRTEMEVHGNMISGLMMIKKTENVFRIVFISELGLKYFDFELDATGKLYRHYLISMLLRKNVEIFLENTLRSMTKSWGTVGEERRFRCEGSGNMVRIVKTQNGKFRYDYHLNFGYVYTSVWKKGLKNGIIIEFEEYDYKAPKVIRAKSRNISLNLNLLGD